MHKYTGIYCLNHAAGTIFTNNHELIAAKSAFLNKILLPLHKILLIKKA